MSGAAPSGAAAEGEAGPAAASERRAILALVGILLGALAVRLAFAGAKSLTVDESFTLAAATAGGPLGALDYVRARDIHPPLYYVLVRAGLDLLGHSALALRLPSVLAGTATVVVLFLLGRETLGRRAGLIAATIAAVHPYFLQMSLEARSHALMLLVTSISLLGLARLHRVGAPTAAGIAAYAASTLAAVYMSHLAGVRVAFEAVVGLARVRAGRRAALRWVATLAGIGLVSLPALALLREQFARRVIIGPEPVAWKALAGVLVHLGEGYRYANMTIPELRVIVASPAALAYLVGGTLPFAILVLAGGWAGLRRSAALRACALIAAVPMLLLVALGRADVVKARYVAHLGVPTVAYLLAAHGLAYGDRRSLAVGGVWGATLLAGTFMELGSPVGTIHREDLRAAAALAQDRESAEVLLECGAEASAAFRIYAPGGPRVREVTLASDGPLETTATSLLAITGRNGAGIEPSVIDRIRARLVAAGFDVEAEVALGADLRGIVARRRRPA